MSMIFKPTIALLGMGYTLSKVAQLLDKNTFIGTVTSESKKDRLLNEGLDVEVLDISNQGSVKSFFEKYQSINTIVDGIPPLGGTDPLIGVKLIAEASSNHGVKRIIYLSTTGVYGVNNGAWVDENTDCVPINIKGQARLDSERLYQKLALKSEIVILRISGIYGPGRGIGTSLKLGKLPFVNNGDRYSNRIQVFDLCSTIIAAIKTVNPPTIVNVADNEPSLMADIVSFYCEKYKLPWPKSISLEDAIQRGIFTLTSNQRIDNKILTGELGVLLKYPSYKEGSETEFTDTQF